MRAEKLVERESNEAEDYSLTVPMKGLSRHQPETRMVEQLRRCARALVTKRQQTDRYSSMKQILFLDILQPLYLLELLISP